MGECDRCGISIEQRKNVAKDEVLKRLESWVKNSKATSVMQIVRENDIVKNELQYRMKQVMGSHYDKHSPIMKAYLDDEMVRASHKLFEKMRVEKRDK